MLSLLDLLVVCIYIYNFYQTVVDGIHAWGYTVLIKVTFY